MRLITPMSLVLLLFMFTLIACEKKNQGLFDEKGQFRVQEFSDPVLSQGQQVWLDNCKACHATGLAGAPKIGNKELWSPRIAKGLDVLFEHAKHGFVGKSGNQMPARGGNLKLTDSQIEAAVTFMTQMSQ